MSARGMYFEEFEVGLEIQTAARTITETDIVNFAGLSGDFNFIHTNAAAAKETSAEMSPGKALAAEERTHRKPMSRIRQRIAARLLEAKHSTAMLTTFNEIDMAHVMAIRRQYKEIFTHKYGVGLGFMSFFIKACIDALKEFSQINAFVDGKDIIEHHYYHIGVAIGSERGLVAQFDDAPAGYEDLDIGWHEFGAGEFVYERPTLWAEDHL